MALRLDIILILVFTMYFQLVTCHVVRIFPGIDTSPCHYFTCLEVVSLQVFDILRNMKNQLLASSQLRLLDLRICLNKLVMEGIGET